YGQGTNQALSPSGDYYAAMVPLDQNVCEIKDETDQEAEKADRVLVVTDLKTMTPKVISGTTAGSAVTSFVWLNDKTLLVSRDSRSNIDSASLYTIDRDGTNTKLLIAAKSFKNKPGYQVPSFYASYPKFPNKILITINRNSNWSEFRDLYWLDINTRKTELVARVPSIKNEAVTNWLLDWNGNAKGFGTFTMEGPDMGVVRSFYKYNQDGSYKRIASCRHQDACFTPISFDIDNKTILGVGQAVKKDGSIINETDTNALWAMDYDTEQYVEMIYHDPDFDISSPLQGDNTLNLWFDETGEGLFGFSYQADKPVDVYFDGYFQSVKKSLEEVFPGERISLSDWSQDLSKFLVSVSSDTNPGASYMFDINKGSLSLISNFAPWLKDYKLAKMEPFTYIARDGLKLHGYITLPPNYKKGTKIPFILHPHGGPNARDYWRYNAEVQFYASRGYGVIQPNYRGSTGHGRNEMILANHQMGKTMQTDKYDALMWANEQGYVDMDNVCISGASYGGYAAMQAATKNPNMFKCIITYVGTFDLTSMDLRGLMWSKAAMPMEYIEKGDPKIPEDYKNLYENSPIFHVENVDDPVLIITGRRDAQVRFQETVDMVAQLEKYGKDYEYIIKGDEGHGFRSEVANLALYEDYEKFLAKHLNK
ncbi:MAG: S9 family peptidase, partial [SAR86 cluster bacterium]|nr:S9 family peptidase [SAR86 cluster bacterium]